MVQTILNVLLILLAIAAIVLVILYFLGSKLQKRQAEQQVYALGQSSRCKSKDRSQGDDSDRRRRSI